MKITKEKGRVILTMSQSDFEDLQFIIQEFDRGNIGCSEYLRGLVKLGWKWCKAVGIPFYGYTVNDS